MARGMYKDVDVEVEIEFSDVIEFITDYASDKQLDEIRQEIGSLNDTTDNGLDGSYIREEKMTLLSLAANRYTLEELEQKLGNKFDLM